jgi:hypothetical protein
MFILYFSLAENTVTIIWRFPALLTSSIISLQNLHLIGASPILVFFFVVFNLFIYLFIYSAFAFYLLLSSKRVGFNK